MDKEKFQLEFNLKNVSLNLLWSTISTPSGLEEWFADNVISRGKKFVFTWSGNSQEAEMISSRTGSFVRFRWDDDAGTKAYFEFKTAIDDITGEVALVITDFADMDDVDDAKILWGKQVKDLFRILGL